MATNERTQNRYVLQNRYKLSINEDVKINEARNKTIKFMKGTLNTHINTHLVLPMPHMDIYNWTEKGTNFNRD